MTAEFSVTVGLIFPYQYPYFQALGRSWLQTLMKTTRKASTVLKIIENLFITYWKTNQNEVKFIVLRVLISQLKMRNYFNLNLSSRQRAKIVSEDLGSVWDATSDFLGVGFQTRVFFFFLQISQEQYWEWQMTLGNLIPLFHFFGVFSVSPLITKLLFASVKMYYSKKKCFPWVYSNSLSKDMGGSRYEKRKYSEIYRD